MKILKFVCLLTACFYLSGCMDGYKGNGGVTSKMVYKAVYTGKPVKIDGNLDDQIWRKAPSYPMYLSKDKIKAGQTLQEAGWVKFAWDDNYFYLAADFNDSDIIAQGTKDQMPHYEYGDLCELFLRPVEDTYYWELYVTPAGKKSSFFYPSHGYLSLPDCLDKYICGLKVAAQCNGTLNKWQDRDHDWTAEMAMPIKDLEAFGAKFGQGHNWKVFVGRYNYSRYLFTPELSMTPQLSRTSYHLLDEYAALDFVK